MPQSVCGGSLVLLLLSGSHIQVNRLAMQLSFMAKTLNGCSSQLIDVWPKDDLTNFMANKKRFKNCMYL